MHAHVDYRQKGQWSVMGCITAWLKEYNCFVLLSCNTTVMSVSGRSMPLFSILFQRNGLTCLPSTIHVFSVGCDHQAGKRRKKSKIMPGGS